MLVTTPSRARREAEALGSDSSEALTRAREALAAEEERALAAQLTGLEAEASDRVRRLSAVDDAQVASLADRLLRVLLEGGKS